MSILFARSHKKEQLDDLDLKGKQLHRILRELEFINAYLGNVRSLVKAIKKATLGKKYVKIVDLGCGGGDVARKIAQILHKSNIDFCYIGIDGNPATINYATQQSTQYPQIKFMVQDIFHKNFTLPQCDLLISSHFVYHFRDEKLVSFINKHSKNIRQAIIFSELRRSFFAYILFQIGTRILRLSKITREDGLLALRRSFNKRELYSIAQQCADDRSIRIQKKLAFRLLLTISQ